MYKNIHTQMKTSQKNLNNLLAEDLRKFMGEGEGLLPGVNGAKRQNFLLIGRTWSNFQHSPVGDR